MEKLNVLFNNDYHRQLESRGRAVNATVKMFFTQISYLEATDQFMLRSNIYTAIFLAFNFVFQSTFTL